MKLPSRSSAIALVHLPVQFTNRRPPFPPQPAELEVSADEEARSQRAVALPPIDGGVRAWLVIVYLEFTVVS